jgi:uncharacterized membrane protein YphA (DoxX/SURF4 family)
MNPYLKTGGRIVAGSLLVLGILLSFVALYSAIDAVPYIMSSHSRFGGGGNSATLNVRFAVCCAIGAIACFRGLARVVREERRGVQI